MVENFPNLIKIVNIIDARSSMNPKQNQEQKNYINHNQNQSAFVIKWKVNKISPLKGTYIQQNPDKNYFRLVGRNYYYTQSNGITYLNERSTQDFIPIKNIAKVKAK